MDDLSERGSGVAQKISIAISSALVISRQCARGNHYVRSSKDRVFMGDRMQVSREIEIWPVCRCRIDLMRSNMSGF